MGPAREKWSEAALGEDSAGRILFIFSRAPFSMHDLNQELLASDIGLVAAQHLEGGPEAQLYVHAGGVEMDLYGSFETSFSGKRQQCNGMADSQCIGSAAPNGAWPLTQLPVAGVGREKLFERKRSTDPAWHDWNVCEAACDQLEA